jgi:hypothetical protein
MIYLLSEASGLELPLAVADSMPELTKICKRNKSSICRAIKDGAKINYFGTMARAYEVKENEE